VSTHAHPTRDRVVRWSIVAFKFVSGLAELATGAIVMIVPSPTIRTLFNLAAREEFREDPHDRLLPFIQHRLPELLGRKTFIGAALIVLGTIKLVGAIGLLLKKPWGYFLLLGVLLVVLPVDLHHAFVSPSLTSEVLIVLNMIVLICLLVFRRVLVAREHG
jgi:uncharacterized membrane protein